VHAFGDTLDGDEASTGSSEEEWCPTGTRRKRRPHARSPGEKGGARRAGEEESKDEVFLERWRERMKKIKLIGSQVCGGRRKLGEERGLRVVFSRSPIWQGEIE
jgi:hypothetical protein